VTFFNIRWPQYTLSDVNWCGCVSKVNMRKWKTGCWRCRWTRRRWKNCRVMTETRMKPAWPVVSLALNLFRVSSQVST